MLQIDNLPPNTIVQMETSSSEVIYAKTQDEARVINVLIIHFLKIVIFAFLQIHHYKLLCVSVREGVFNPFRTSVHAKCSVEHCLSIVNYLIRLPSAGKLSPEQQLSLMTERDHSPWIFI